MYSSTQLTNSCVHAHSCGLRRPGWKCARRISQLISSSKRSNVPKVIVFLLCRLNFTWNTAELTQLASAHHGIRILAFFQSFGSAANRNRANHTNLVPIRQGSDEALILAYGLVRQCLEVPHMVPQNAVHKYPRLLWTA